MTTIEVPKPAGWYIVYKSDKAIAVGHTFDSEEHAKISLAGMGEGFRDVVEIVQR